MPTYWTPVERGLRRVDSLRAKGKTDAAVEEAVELVVRYQQPLGQMARHAGVSPYRLRQVLMQHPVIVAQLQRADERAEALLARRAAAQSSDPSGQQHDDVLDVDAETT